MVQRNNSSLNKGMLCRPRLNSLIRDGLGHSLLVMLAGPGYGKTQAMSAYLAESKASSLWLRLTNLDNLPTHFWNHVVQAFKPEYPGLSQSLYSLGFPDSLSSFDAFIKILVTNYTVAKQLVLVFDDFGVVHNEQIKTFFRMLVDMELQQFPLALISSELTSTESIAFMSSKRFLVLANDLRFTRSEIAELYHMHNLDLETGELANIEQHTEGWALALHLLVQRRDKVPGPRLIDDIAITHMFEERFFSAYSEKQRLMMARLGQLDYFSKELAIALYDGDPVELEELGNHPFYAPEPGTGRLFLHHLYHLFLQAKQYMLSEEDKRQTWQTAAEHYAASGDVMEAISCYRKNGDHAGMLKVIGGFARNLRNITEEEAGFLLEHLDLLTPLEAREYPIADYLRAHLLMNLLELDKAEALLLNLEERLIGCISQGEALLLGDIYVALSFVHMMRNQEDYPDFFKKAADLLPEGSSFYDRRTLAMENNNCFALADNQPGARERMEQAAFKAAPWIDKVLRGCMSGMEYIISAESAFMIGDFETARQQAYRGIYKAEASAQHDYVCNGYFVLIRIGFLQGDLEEMSGQARNVVEYAEKYKIAVVEEIRDTILTWYYMKLHDFSRIPKSIIAMDFSKRPLTAYGRSQIAYASYLTAKAEYAKLVGLLEHPRGLFLSGGIWHDRICLFILMAIGHHHLGNGEAAMKAFWTAYDMCRHNKLTTIFIETGDYLLPLMRQARRQRQYDFSPQWLDAIYGQAKSFVRRAEAVRAEYRKQHPSRTARDNPLSKREKDVLQALSQGLTREEIALKQYISVNTVKAAIRSIYTKLNANNRAEAVSIAIIHGYIEAGMGQ